jgi:aspartate oxidase
MTSLFDSPVDLLVIGSGVAGCATALEAANAAQKAGENSFRVIVLTAANDALKTSNSYWAQVRVLR